MFRTSTAASLFTARILILHFEYLLLASRPLAQSKTPFETPAQGTQLRLTGNERINKSNAMATHAWD
jgi:hypothetical protein